MQYKKFKWNYYQTKNFNVYYNQGGQELAKFVAQSCRKRIAADRNCSRIQPAAPCQHCGVQQLCRYAAKQYRPWVRLAEHHQYQTGEQ